MPSVRSLPTSPTKPLFIIDTYLDAYATGVAKSPPEGIEACASDVNNPKWPSKLSKSWASCTYAHPICWKYVRITMTGLNIQP